MVSFSSVLVAPLRGIVWVAKLPFVLVWMLLRYVGSCIYAAVAAVLSVPARFLGRVGTRIKLMWTWTKTSAGKIKLCLPVFSNFSNPLSESGMKSLPPPPGREYGSYYGYSEDMKSYPHSPEEGRSSRRRRHSSRRSSRKAIAAALARLLLEPLSPSDSDEDSEVRTARSSRPEEDRTVKLIMDLLKISKTEGDPQITGLTPQELQSLREHARNKRQLESLIAEVDKVAQEVDSSLLLTSRQQQSSSPPASPKSERFADKSGGGSNINATSRHAKKTHKVSNDVNPAGCDEKDENEEGRLAGEKESQYTAPHRHRYSGDLSPVQESPEYKSEELNYKELEKDLNLALSRLNSEISELQVDEEVRAESVETVITHTITVTNTQQLSEEKKEEEEEEEEEGLFQDSHEEFPSVPKVNPSLGLKAGHDRRDLAAARRPRPPTRKAGATAQQDDPVSEDSWDDDSYLNGSGESEGEEGGDDPGRKHQPKQLVGGLQLSDQLQLLSPTSKSQTRMTSEEDAETSAVGAMPTAATEDIYAKVNKKKNSGTRGDQNRPRTVSDPTPTAIGQSGSTSRSSSHSMSSDHGNKGLEDSVKEKDKSGHFKPSTQPPWVELRSHKSGESSARPTTTHHSTVTSSQPPWIEMRSQKSGHPSPASTPTNAPHPSHTHSTPQSTPQSIATAAAAVADIPHRVLPQKLSIPRPDPPTDSLSAPLIQPYLSEEERKDDGFDSDENGDSFYDTLQPKEVPQLESRIFPLDETHLQREDRPRYLHEALTQSERDTERSDLCRSRRSGSVRLKDASPALSLKSSGTKLKRTSSADTVRRPVKKGHEHVKQRHTSSSSVRDGDQSRGRSDVRQSSDDHRRRHQSSSNDRTPSRSRHHSSEKRGSTSSSKGSPSPKESTSALSAMWKLLATPTSSRKRHSSSSKDSPSSKKSEREVKQHHSSSRRDENSPSSKN